jgi:hypothetical protein
MEPEIVTPPTEEDQFDPIQELRAIVCSAVAQSPDIPMATEDFHRITDTSVRFRKACEAWDAGSGEFVGKYGHVLENAILSLLTEVFAETHLVSVHAQRILLLRSRSVGHIPSTRLFPASPC